MPDINPSAVAEYGSFLLDTSVALSGDNGTMSGLSLSASALGVVADAAAVDADHTTAALEASEVISGLMGYLDIDGEKVLLCAALGDEAFNG